MKALSLLILLIATACRTVEPVPGSKAELRVVPVKRYDSELLIRLVISNRLQDAFVYRGYSWGEVLVNVERKGFRGWRERGFTCGDGALPFSIAPGESRELRTRVYAEPGEVIRLVVHGEDGSRAVSAPLK